MNCQEISSQYFQGMVKTEAMFENCYLVVAGCWFMCYFCYHDNWICPSGSQQSRR